MSKKILYIIILALLFLCVFLYFKSPSKDRTPDFKETTSATSTPKIDHKNISYTIDDQKVILINGISQSKPDPTTETSVVTEYFGNEAKGDLNGDGINDVVFLVRQHGGGTGTFYFVVVALANKDSYTGTNAEFIGDRILPQTTEIRNGKVIVNYADRKPDEPMVARPSVGVTKYFKVNNGLLTPTDPK